MQHHKRVSYNVTFRQGAKTWVERVDSLGGLESAWLMGADAPDFGGQTYRLEFDVRPEDARGDVIAHPRLGEPRKLGTLQMDLVVP